VVKYSNAHRSLISAMARLVALAFSFMFFVCFLLNVIAVSTHYYFSVSTTPSDDYYYLNLKIKAHVGLFKTCFDFGGGETCDTISGATSRMKAEQAFAILAVLFSFLGFVGRLFGASSSNKLFGLVGYGVFLLSCTSRLFYQRISATT
jgi:hypothetical protein